MQQVLSIEGLTIDCPLNGEYYNVIDDVSLHIDAGETLGLVGESGCGKSITSMAIMRLLGQDIRVRGKIVYKDKDLLELSSRQMRDVRGNEIGMIFQEPMTSLYPVYRIGAQISEGLIVHKKMPAKRAWQEAVELLRQVGIPRPEAIADEYPHSLSGGMRQRVMIAMAMACKPTLLIADEPTTALDVTIQAQILDLIRGLTATRHMSTLLITHDLGVVAEMCDRVAIMYAGRIVEEGDVRQILRLPQHPYTVGLIQSIPQLGAEKRRLKPIDGNVPSIQDMASGCRFHPRCSFAKEVCLSHPPDLSMVEEGHTIRCWMHS